MSKLVFRGAETEKEINLGFKTATLRQRNPNYDFPAGEKITGEFSDSGGQVPLIVIRSIAGEIDSLDLRALALDGIFSRREAVKKLDDYYGPGHNGYSKVNCEVFLTEDRFEGLVPKQRQKLLESEVSRSISDPEFAALFLPGIAYYYFLVRYPYKTYADYLEWVKSSHLVDKKRIQATRGYYDDETFKAIGSADIGEMLRSRTSDYYKKLILFSSTN